MYKSPAKDLFQLQSDLIDMKVEMTVSKSIDRVIEQIQHLENKMHVEMSRIRHDMNNRFSALENRVVAIETRLGMVSETQKKFVIN